MGHEDELVLDPQIRDFVLLPIIVLMFLVSLLRHYITVAIGNPEKKAELKKIIPGQVLTRSQRLRRSANRIPESAFLKRKAYFSNKESGPMAAPAEQESSSPMGLMMNNPMMDPSSMGNMMKKNTTMVVSNMFFYTWIDRSFAGFVSVKLPFALTRGFKAMFQAGIDLQALDVSYVSSMSWYILTLTGLRGINSLVLGANNAADDTAMMAQFGGPMAASAATEVQQPPAKLYQAERDSLDLVQHKFDLSNTESRLLQKYGYAPSVQK